MSRTRKSQKCFEQLHCPLEQAPQGEYRYHPQRKYFELYEKYTLKASDACTFLDQKDTRPYAYNFAPKGNVEQQNHKERISQLETENMALRKEILDQKELIDRLKYELYYCNTQLDQISKIESFEYQQAVDDLREQIEQLLQHNINVEQELSQLRQKKHEFRTQFNKYPSSDRQNYKINRLMQYNVYGSQLSVQNFSIKAQERQVYAAKKEDQLIKQFVCNLKDMYGKTMGGDAKSLKQLWKWLKEVVQINGKLKKWSRRYRQSLKIPISIKTQTLIKYIDEAIAIIS